MKNFKKLKIPKLFQQISGLIASNILLIIIGFAIKKIQTNQLGSINYGEYAFFISIVSFLSLFFRFGFFVSLRNLLATNQNFSREKKILGVGVIVAIFIGIGLTVAVWLFGLIVNDLFQTNIGYSLQLFSPFTITYTFYYLFNSYSEGSNKINIIAVFNYLPKLIFLVSLILFLNELTIDLVIFLNLSSTLIVIIYYIIKLKPDFSDLKKYWKLLLLKNRKYGFHYYTGAIANQTTFKLDQLFIAYFINTTYLGFYSLALLITSPMTMFSRALSQSMYKEYSTLKKIPRKIFIYNTLWLAGCVITLYICSNYLVSFLFGIEYKIVGKYIVYISVAFFFQGLSSPYVFLSAKSKGKEIRNIAWGEALVNILGNIILIPILGVEGAIITSIISKGVNYFLFRYYYKNYLIQVNE